MVSSGHFFLPSSRSKSSQELSQINRYVGSRRGRQQQIYKVGGENKSTAKFLITSSSVTDRDTPNS